MMATDKENLNPLQANAQSSLNKKTLNFNRGSGLQKRALKDATNVKEPRFAKSLIPEKLQNQKLQKILPILTDSNPATSMACQPTRQASNPSSASPNTCVEDNSNKNIPLPSPTSHTFASIEAGGRSDNIAPPNVGALSDDACNVNEEAVLLSNDLATLSPHSNNRGEHKAKSRSSNLRSTLTPILKYLTLGWKHPKSHSPKLDRTRKNDGLCQSHNPLDTSGTPEHVFRPVQDPTEKWIQDESFPSCIGISLLDASVDCTLNSPSFLPNTPASIKPEEKMVIEEKSRQILFEETQSVNGSRCRDHEETKHSCEIGTHNLVAKMAQSASELPSLSTSATDCDKEMINSKNGNINLPASAMVVPDHVLSPKPEPSEQRIEDESFPNCSSISIYNTTVDGSINFPSYPPKTPVSMKSEKEVVNMPKEEDNYVAVEGNSMQISLGETLSINSSSCSRVSLEGTRDISTLKDNKDIAPLLRCEAQNQTVEMGGSPHSLSGADCDGKINGTFELQGEPAEKLELLSNLANTLPKHVTTLELPLSNVKTLSSLNNTFDTRLPLQLSGTNSVLKPVNTLNNTFEAQSSLNHSVATTGINPGNNTFEVSVTTTDTDSNGVTATHQNKTFETEIENKFIDTTIKTNVQTLSHQNMSFEAKSSLKVNQTTEKETSINEVSQRNNTFDSKTVNLQNNTLEIQSSVKHSDSISESETSGKVSPQYTVEAQGSPKLNRSTNTREDSDKIASSHSNSFGDHFSMTVSCTGTETEDGVKIVGLQNNACESHMSLPLTVSNAEANVEAAETLVLPLSITPQSLPGEASSTDVDVIEQKIQSQPGPSWKDECSYGLFNHTVDMETSLDGTLELGSNSLITSTPMPDSKAFHFRLKRGKEGTSQSWQRLSGDALQKQTTQLPPAVSNIISDRKTFFKASGASSLPKSLIPPLRPASQLPSLAGLSKTKSALAAPAPSEPPVSALSNIRRITRAGTAIKAMAAISQESSAVSTLSVRSTIPDSKLPTTGLRKPKVCSLPSGIQRSLPTLRPLPGKAIEASSNDKPSGSAATLGSKTTKTVQTSSQSQKHLMTSSEALPLAKRKKIDIPAPSTHSESIPVCAAEPARGARVLRRIGTSLKAGPPKKQNPGVKQISGTFTSKPATKAACQAAPTGAVPSVSTQPANHSRECANCLILQQELERYRQENKRLQDELQDRMDL